MSSPRSPILDEVIRNIMEDVLHERAEQLENQETTLKEVRKETKEVEVEAGEVQVFFTETRAKLF